MIDEKIFIVEDERIVAEDLKRMLERLGYRVVGSASNGEDALKKIEETKPQLVLMDIRIQGPMDGIEVAEHVAAEYEIPVIYLTAYADDITLDRAKGTMAFGYILKPFVELDLKTTIELTLYRHKMDMMLKSAGDWHGGILENLSAAVVAVDIKGNVMYMNKMAEGLTGHAFDKTFGKRLEMVVPDSLSLNCKKSTINDQEGNVRGTALLFPAK